MAKQTPWEFAQWPAEGWNDLFTLKHHREVARKWLGESAATASEIMAVNPMEYHRFNISNAEQDAKMVAAICVLTDRIGELHRGEG